MEISNKKNRFIKRLVHLVNRIKNASIQRIRKKELWNATKSLENLILHRFFKEDTGKFYFLNQNEKRELLKKIKKITQGVPSGTSWLYHVVLATEIFKIPPDVCYGPSRDHTAERFLLSSA